MTKSTITRDELNEVIATYGKHHIAHRMANVLLSAMDCEPVATADPISFDEWSRKCALQITLCYPDFREKAKYIWDSARETQQPAPVVPENCVTAEHRRVIEMLLSVCGAAFELADDSCQQDVDGEDCHVVPDDAFQKLSDALDEIENTLPTEDIDRPDVFLAWSAMPRAALKSILQAQPAPVIPDEMTPEQAYEIGDYHGDPVEVFARGANWMRQHILDSTLAAAPQSPGSEPATVPGKWIPVCERMPLTPSADCEYSDIEVNVFDGERVFTAHYATGSQPQPCGYWIDTYAKITHWQPLPAAPQEDKP